MRIPKIKPDTGERYTEVRFDRCMRVVRMGGGTYLIRTWREPFRTRLFDPNDLLMREVKPSKPKKEKAPKGSPRYYYENAADHVRNEMAKHSTLWALYNLHRDLGFNPKDSYRDARKMCRQSREWKKILRDGSDPRKMSTKAFYERLKRRPKLFE
jgi:hypothetical protein